MLINIRVTLLPRNKEIHVSKKIILLISI